MIGIGMPISQSRPPFSIALSTSDRSTNGEAGRKFLEPGPAGGNALDLGGGVAAVSGAG